MKIEQIDALSAVISPSEGIDLTNSNKLKEEFFTLYDEGVTHVTIDFTNVDGIDSAGLGRLLLFQKKLKEKDGNLRIVNITSEYVNRVFNMIHLHRVIAIE